MEWGDEIPSEQWPCLRRLIDGDATEAAVRAAWEECVPNQVEQKRQQSLDDIISHVLPNIFSAHVHIARVSQALRECLAESYPPTHADLPTFIVGPRGLGLPAIITTGL